MFKTILLIFVLFASSFAGVGVNFGYWDIEQEVFGCLSNGNRFLIQEIWTAEDGVNPAFADNWKKAKAAGISSYDASAWICNNCTGNNPTNICKSIKKALPDDFDGKVWIEVYWYPGYWVGDAATRMIFVQAVAAQCLANGLKIGIYSSSSKWEQVFGSADYDAGLLKSFPLWYAHYDGEPSMNDWSSVKFGGFNKPTLKQYIPYGDITVCSLVSGYNSS